MSVRFSTRLGRTSEDNTEDGLSGNFETSLLRIYYLNDLHDASYKTCLVMPMQSRDNDKIFQLRVRMLDNHDNDAPMRCRIAVVVQCNDGMFHAQNEMVHMRQCNCQDVVPMIHTP